MTGAEMATIISIVRDEAAGQCRRCAEEGAPVRFDAQGVYWHESGGECNASALQRILAEIKLLPKS